MLKLMKYEFRKTRTTLLVMLAALAVLEAGFLIGDRIDDYRVAGVCLGILTVLVFAVYVYILIAGITSYSKEINDKTGYMTFMVPVSPMGIVGSKLLFTVLAALVVTALFGGAVYYDYAQLFKRLEIDKASYDQMSFAFSMFSGTLGPNFSLARVILTIGFEVGTVLIEIILVMCTAYLAITLTATALQNKKGFLRILVSVLFFFALNFITSRVSSLAMRDAMPQTTEELLSMLGAQAAINFAFAAVFAGATAWLLDRKVNL